MTRARLQTDDIERLNFAQRVLLSPLSQTDPGEWQLRANTAVRRLVGADHSVFSFPTETGPALVTDDTDPSFPERFLSYCMGVEEGENRFRDPLVENAGRARRAAGTGAFHELALGGKEAIRKSPAYQEIFVPAGLTHLIGFSTPLSVGEATQFFSFEGVSASQRSERGLALLQLLVPAFEAGVLTQLRKAAGRMAISTALERLGQAAAAFSISGVPLYRTAALREMLSDEVEAERLWERMSELASGLTARWSVPGKTSDPSRLPEARAQVRTAATEYRLSACYFDEALVGAEGVLVHVERLRPLLPSVADLCKRYGLTPREAEVALLLAEGLTDGGIAASFGLSPHTARRYSERVLGKLGLHCRAAVAVTLLRGGAEPAG